ncbi:hypothetical protein BDE36_2832 [Arcticibacter tournemirensis]|uniref:hypothetical protein n=1 Tax=Arcticibacter tournemirensis TaxID=699437 RepID=UPI001171E526|nr:hypothetical protein [Arcticibacter tournemirensis]TQM51064.1 hypothetical protein BDE36_2832 [Arcticibacter tournemirensis]
MRRNRKLWAPGAVMLAGLMLDSFAFAIIQDSLSPAIMIIAAILFLGGIIWFAANFRE